MKLDEKIGKIAKITNVLMNPCWHTILIKLNEK